MVGYSRESYWVVFIGGFCCYMNILEVEFTFGDDKISVTGIRICGL